MRRLFFALFALSLTAAASAQTVTADRLKLNSGPVVISSGAGAPSGGANGDTYIRTDGTFYIRTGGAWVALGSGIGYPGAGVPVSTGSAWGTSLSSTNLAAIAGGTWAGATSITTLGTITTGVWNAGAVTSSGNIAANGGSFTSTDNLSITPAASKYLILNSGQSIWLNPASGYVMPNFPYQINLGSLASKYLTLHAAELWVETLVAHNTIATIGGRVLVAPTTTLAIDLSANYGKLFVKHNNLANGDRVYLESNGKVEFMAVTSAATDCTTPSACNYDGAFYQYSVTNDLDGSGGNLWYAGDAVLNTGTTGDGFIDLYSVSGVLSGYGPTIVGNVRTGTTYNNIAPRWAAGNLYNLYDYGADTYGFAAGEYAATWLAMDSTNGLRIMYGGSPRVTITAAGVATFYGVGTNLTSINGGNIQTGTVTATQITTGTITATQIAANTITANKMLLQAGFGGALNDDPGFLDPTAWQYAVNVVTGITDGKVGPNAMANTANNALWGFSLRGIPIDHTKTYRVRTWIRKASGSGSDATYVWIREHGYDNVAISPGDIYPTPCTGTTTSGTWTECVGVMGAGTAYPFHSNARFMYAGYGLNNAATSSVIQMQDLRIEEAIPATLVVDGTITAAKMTVAGGWTWATDYLKRDTGTPATSAGIAPIDYPFYAGQDYANRATAPFRVTPAGALTATSATITGTVNATAGYFGSGSTKVAINSDGLDVGSAGRILGGMTAYNTGTGFWLGYSGAYKFSIGHDDGQRLTWDGTDLTVVAATLGISSAGITITPDTTFQVSRMYGFESSLIGLGYVGGSSDTLALYTNHKIQFIKYDSGVVWGWELAEKALTVSGSDYEIGASGQPINRIYATTYYGGTSAGATYDPLTCGSGEAVTDVTVRGGIVTAMYCTAPSPSLAGRVLSLEQRISDLEAIIARRQQ